MISSIFRYSVPCRYVSRQCPHKLKAPYLVMDYIDSTEGVMLSESWEESRHDQTRRKNLFTGLSRIILSLALLPFERIGSLTIDNRGVIRLRNRPLTLRLQHLENQSVPTSINRDLTYCSPDAYFLDLLGYHDSYLRHSPNSVRDELDGQAQLSTLTIMRAILPHFTNRDFYRGSFILNLTDLHQSNIFVDGDWNIKCLVDLEWTCSRPIEMLHPPYWLTSRGVDQLEEGEHLNAFKHMHSEFMDAFSNEEEVLSEKEPGAFSLTRIIKRGLENGSFWYSHALDNLKGLYNIFLDHIQPIFTKLDVDGVDRLEQAVAPYWSADMQGFLAKKLKDQEEYQNKLREAFVVAKAEPR
ncbi:uncharacterized protein KD926_006659 [Aspergillus affinis]|uniref:uncharacterized protein n=1 Tax=Aspergillus affinis TaxID=1070780 RepID=UPI0022FF0132|nr:uncharacterized protein KD926_006659 [Aspergillus affinis]KAI9041585.1 hypothetical protein KD926_006659 [Aspergillus affinis]